jgi:CheY-like chemotaxis protein
MLHVTSKDRQEPPLSPKGNKPIDTREIMAMLQDAPEIRQPLKNRRTSVSELEKHLASLLEWLSDSRNAMPVQTIISFENICKLLSEDIRQLGMCLSKEEISFTQLSETNHSLSDKIITPLHGTLGITAQLKVTIKNLLDLVDQELKKLSGLNLPRLVEICNLITDDINAIEENTNKQGNAAEEKIRKLSPKPTPYPIAWKKVAENEPTQVAKTLSSLSLTAASTATASKKIRVLITDDNDVNRSILARFFLNNPEYEFALAEDGQKAVDKYLEFKPDIILMDIMMPVLDGIEATIAIRAKEKELKLTPGVCIIATTTESHVKENAINAGMNDFIAKPFDKDTIIKAIIQNLARTPTNENASSSHQSTGIKI